MDDGLTLGTAIVEIGGDLTKLLAAFEEARKERDAFDKSMAVGSSGLIQLNKAASSAGDAIDKQAKSTKAGADANTAAAASVDRLAKANVDSAKAAKTASDAMETEAQKTARLSAMVDASIAKLNQQNRLTTQRPPGFAYTAAPGLSAVDQAKQNAAMGLSGAGKIPKDVLDGAAIAGEAKVAADGIKKTVDEVEDLGSKTKISSSSIREILVLIREMGRGDFTRMSGSASLLAQNLGLVEAVGLPMIATFAAIAAAVGVVGAAFVEGSRDANIFENSLALGGNYAGLTAESYLKMAQAIEAGAGGSIAANEKLISSLAKTNDFTADEIAALVSAAQTLSKATSDSADDVVADFERMAQGPTAYAEEFQRTHIDIIQPLQLQAIRDLEARGDKEGAIALLIKDVTDGIAKNAIDNSNIIVRAWHAAENAVSDYWGQLKRALSGGGTDAEKLADLTMKINTLKTSNSPLAIMMHGSLPGMEAQQAALQKQVAAEQAAADGQLALAQQTKRTNDAVADLHGTYSTMIDDTTRLSNDTAKLKTTLAAAAGLPKTFDAAKASVGELQKAVAKSGSTDPLVQNLSKNLPAAIDKLKKQDLPAAFKADTKAANEAASAAKKLANEAAALEKRRQEAIGNAKDEAGMLGQLLPLYQDQALSLDDISRAKDIQNALSHAKLSADSAEGKQLAALIGQVHDYNKAIDDETKKRQTILGLQSKDQGLQNQIALVGKSGGDLATAQARLDAFTDAMRDHIKITPEFTAAVEKWAGAIGEDTDKLAHADFLDETNKAFAESTKQINEQIATLTMGREATAAFTREQDLLNEAAQKHIALSPQDISAIHQQAAAYGTETEQLAKLNEAQTRNQFVNDELESTLEDVIFNAKSLTDSLADMAKAFAKAAFEAALFGNGPLAGLFGGSQASTGSQGAGGFLMKLLGGIMGGGGGGASAGAGAIADSIPDLGSSLTGVVLHSGTRNARPGAGSTRSLPISSFIGAPRYHNGLRPDEFPAILQKGEGVSSRAENRAGGNGRGRGGGTTINVYPKDYDSFRGSQRQLARKAREAMNG